jgi:HSP20 family protein
MKFDPDPWERAMGFPLLNRLGREFDAVFGRLGLDRPFTEAMPTMWTPQIEVITKPTEFCVKVDVPGIRKEDLSIEVAEEHLVLKGERKQEKEEKKDGFIKTERSYGSFVRTVPLPEGVKAELAKATMHDGVLEITMPMMKVESRTRRLEIAEPTPPAQTKAA